MLDQRVLQVLHVDAQLLLGQRVAHLHKHLRKKRACRGEANGCGMDEARRAAYGLALREQVAILRLALALAAQRGQTRRQRACTTALAALSPLNGVEDGVLGELAVLVEHEGLPGRTHVSVSEPAPHNCYLALRCAYLVVPLARLRQLEDVFALAELFLRSARTHARTGKQAGKPHTRLRTASHAAALS